jgi:hypothetical protein
MVLEEDSNLCYKALIIYGFLGRKLKKAPKRAPRKFLPRLPAD